jgi:predicted nucleic acid-binding Zn ribbon protein
MAEKNSTKVKKASKPVKMGREARRMRTMNIIFLVITAILILSMILAAVGRF